MTSKKKSANLISENMEIALTWGIIISAWAQLFLFGCHQSEKIGAISLGVAVVVTIYFCVSGEIELLD